MEMNNAMNAVSAAARHPAVQQAAKDAVSATAGATMDKLVAKERDVAARMQNLKERQQQVLLALESLRPNWPRQFLCIRPFVYHNIDQAVPADRIRYAKSSYTCYFCTIVLLIYNWICCLAGLLSPSNASGSSTNYSSQLILATIQLVGGIPGAFIVWHFQIYTAIQPKGPISRYGKAYLGVGIAFLYSVFMAIGWVGYGGAGFLFAMNLQSSKQSSAPFDMSIVCGVLWVLEALYFVWSFKQLRRYKAQDKAAQNPIASAVASAAGHMTNIAAMAI